MEHITITSFYSKVVQYPSMDLNNQPAHFLVLPCVNMVKLIPALLDKFDNIKFNKNVTLQIWNLKFCADKTNCTTRSLRRDCILLICILVSSYFIIIMKKVFFWQKKVYEMWKKNPVQRKVKTLTIKFFQTKYFFFRNIQSL